MADSTSIILTSFHPFPTLSFSLPTWTPLSSLPSLLSPLLPVSSQSLSSRSGKSISVRSSGNVGGLQKGGFVELRLVPKVLGGKGGFGSQLRAAGGRMSSHKASNNDSCRDLNGRRLSTINAAKKLAASIASEPEREAATRKKAEERLAALNEEISRLDAAVNGSASGSKRRLDDAEQTDKQKDSREKLRGAVANAMLKKRKKNKTSPPAAASTSGASAPAAEGKAKAVEEATKAPAVAAV